MIKISLKRRFSLKVWSPKEDYEVLEKYTMALFKRGTEIAKERGLILVDTKYEFGHRDGKIYLIDEDPYSDSSVISTQKDDEDRFIKGNRRSNFQRSSSTNG